MVGIDEVGRGAWAGPLLVCAVRLHKPVIGLKDSKQLTPKRRNELAEQIKLCADIGYGWVSAKTIDDIGLAKALQLATDKALDEITLESQEEIIIDGTVNYAPTLNVKTIVKADQTVPAVSAASIVAKVARDAHMRFLAKQFPKYGFEKHVGYGTRAHTDALKLYGISIHHRTSFKPCKEFKV
jgi:ribonuclease HII